jgi:hypothetical protein
MRSTEQIMHLHTYLRFLLHVGLVALALVGCSLVSSDIRPAADCGYSVTGRAWVDADADGTWDQTEVPLAGVSLVVLAEPDGPLIQQSPPSNATGHMSAVFIGGCESMDGEVAASAEPPPGFTPTTPDPVIVRVESDRQTVPTPIQLPTLTTPQPMGVLTVPQPGISPTMEFGFRPAP